LCHKEEVWGKIKQKVDRFPGDRYGWTSKGSQRYFFPNFQQTFSETFDTLYYLRQVSEEDVRIVLQSHAEGSSLRGISRISGLAYDAVVSTEGKTG